MREEPHPPAASLYVHVPFCAQKCEYCAFYSTAADGTLVNRYVASLVRELELRGDEIAGPPSTVFFGGGTPSLLNLRQWETVRAAFERQGLLGAPEWTVECNPATVSPDKARFLREMGVNRVSMGVQSLDEALLDRLGRVHSRDMVFRSFDVLRDAGFERINLDLMFGIPGQTMGIWRETLGEAVAMGSEHLSCYEVIYEEDTPLFAQLKAGEFDVDEDLVVAMFDELIDHAGAAGFHQYEVANFARDARVRTAAEVPPGQAWIPSEACRHNVTYWRGGDHAALGPSATGFVAGWRRRNVANTTLYCERIEAGLPAADWEEHLGPLARAGEIAAFGLRMNAGWPWDTFVEVTGMDLRTEWGSEMDSLVEKGWGERDAVGFRLTRRGLRFADAAGADFLRPNIHPVGASKAAPTVG
ncbi:MAG: radical SAM family heme chaperone HemW [Limisphaerales bacterium]